MTRYTWKRITEDVYGETISWWLGTSTDPDRPATTEIIKTRDGWMIEGGRGARFGTLKAAQEDAEWCLEQQPKTPKPAEAPSTKEETWKAEMPASNDDAIPAPPLVTVSEIPTAEDCLAHELRKIAEGKKIIDDQEDNLTWHVDRARRAGATWAQIGETLGLSLQGAHKRYGAKRPRKPGGGETPMF